MQISFHNAKPIYQQIVEQILTRIKSGELKPGDRLPTERELAAALSVSRGTVKKAYKELADNNIIEVIQGSGSYVYNDRDVSTVERRSLALDLIKGLFDKLASWDFTPEEISTLTRMSLMQRTRDSGAIRVALVDCSPESLSIFKRQLTYIPNLSISVFMVESIIMDDEPCSLLADFDLVLTTATHYEQLAPVLAGMAAPLIPVSVAPSRATIVSIGALGRDANVGIICTSNKFANLICEQLALFSPSLAVPPVHFESSLANTARFLAPLDAVIAAPNALLFDASVSGGTLETFLSAGGQVIPFDYLIDRASLVHIEQQIELLLQKQYSRPQNAPPAD